MVSLQRSFPRPSLSQLSKFLMSSSREIKSFGTRIVPPGIIIIKSALLLQDLPTSPCLSLQQSCNVIKLEVNLKLQIEIIQLQAFSLTVFSSGWHISTHNGESVGRKSEDLGLSPSASAFQFCDLGQVIWPHWFTVSTFLKQEMIICTLSLV